jgi:hypothetical protein
MIDDIKFKGKSGLFMVPISNNRPIDIQVGCLYIVRDRLCIVVEVTNKKEKWKRRVLMRWVDNEDMYWLSYDIFSQLVREAQNESG